MVALWAERSPEVSRAWIFGSYANESARPESDLDVAIEITAEVIIKIGVEKFWYRHHSRLQEQLQRLVGKVPVQLEMYHRYYGAIVYQAINSNKLKPVYRRSKKS